MRGLKPLTALALAALAAGPVFAQEPAQPPALESLRAGAVSEAGSSLSDAERASLAASAAPALESLRAADLNLSDHDLEIILVTAAAVVILVVLL